MATTTRKKSRGNGAALMEAPAGLEPGSSGDDVELLQHYLTQFGYLATPPSKEDGRKAELDLRPMAEPGKFDEATEEALRIFQKMASLPITGKLDKATREKMRQPRCGNPDITPVSNPTILSLVDPDVASFVATGGRWPTRNLRYAFQERGSTCPPPRYARHPPGVQHLGRVDRSELPGSPTGERAGDHHPLRRWRPRRRKPVRRRERRPRPRLLPAGAPKRADPRSRATRTSTRPRRGRSPFRRAPGSST